MTNSISGLSVPANGPHSKIETTSESERFLADLFDVLWDRYRQRVEYVRMYEKVVREAGGTFVNDHIAFRTLAGQNPLTGITSLSRIFTALGYRAITCYQFEDKHLDAIHFQHPNAEFPKLFISELRTWELSRDAQTLLTELLATQRPNLSMDALSSLANLEGLETAARKSLLETVVKIFHELPWNAPEKDSVTTLNEESQYAAWVAVHGFNVNHFTALINSHGVEQLNDIEKTIAALSAAGVPMKANIEGEAGSRLRQSATEAVVIDVPVSENGSPGTMPWTYAYFELAERGNVTDPESGASTRFEGFLGPQATHLFEMTRRKKNN